MGLEKLKRGALGDLSAAEIEEKRLQSAEKMRYGSVSAGDGLSEKKAAEATKDLHKAILAKETKGSGVYKIEAEDEEVKEFLRENFNAGLTALENDIKIAAQEFENINKGNLAGEALEYASLELEMKVMELESRMKASTELYKKDPFPEMYNSLNETMLMFDQLKIGQLKSKINKTSN